MSPFFSPPFIISMLIALSVHECAHAYAAYKLGDPTAKYDGRLTLNPLSHLDPLGTLMFLFVGFGWAKPVPVDPKYFKKTKRDVALVAGAGPLSNLILAIIAIGILLLITGGEMQSSAMSLLRMQSDNAVLLLIVQICATSLFINLALMAFNLLPIAPLDGSKILAMFIPYQYEREYEEFMRKGPFFLIGILLLENLAGIPLLSGWVFGIINVVLSILLSIFSIVSF